MAPRQDLHQLLKAITSNVYYQPPENLKMNYPCIVYARDFANTSFADNKPYSHTIRYMITVIDRDPDSELPDKIAALPMSVFNRFFLADNLNHNVYSMYF